MLHCSISQSTSSSFNDVFPLYPEPTQQTWEGRRCVRSRFKAWGTVQDRCVKRGEGDPQPWESTPCCSRRRGI